MDVKTSRTSSRRVAATGVAGVALTIAGLASFGQPLHAAAAANPTACGPLWTETGSDATVNGSGQQDQLDILSGFIRDDGTSLTAQLNIKNLSETVPSGGTANNYYLVFGTAGGTQYFANATYDVTPAAGGVTYSYGTYSSSTGYSTTGSATGTFTTGQGTTTSAAGSPGTITVSVPLSAVGTPAAGTTFPASQVYGETSVLEGQSQAGGIVLTVDQDKATYDYVVGSCGSSTGGGGSTATPTPTPTSTTSASSASTCTAQTPETNVAAGSWVCPVEIPQSSGLGEPTLIHDSGTGNNGTARLFVTAPQSIGNVQNGGSPLYTSTDSGKTWGAPVRSTLCSGLSGGDTDLAADAADNVYGTDLWLGNSCMSASEDHGASWTAGDPFGQEVQPGDDRPWLAYSASANELFGTYDGVNAVHVTSTAPLVNPAAGLQAISDNAAIPESLVSGSAVPSYVRQCVCPPGGIAVDNSSGSHAGRVYVAYSYQSGEAISYADPTCTPAGGCAIPQSSWNSFGAPPTVVPNSGSSGSAFEDEWNFSPVKVDSNGVVYVMFARAVNFNAGNTAAGSKGVQIFYAYSTDGGNSFSQPVLVSTEDGADGTLGTTTFPTMDVAAPGVLDLAWYGTPHGGDPNSVPSTAQWNLYYTRVTNAASTSASVATPTVAISDMHNGCIQTGGGKACTDRSLLDFFQLTDVNGNPDVIYTAGDATSGTNLWFTTLDPAPQANVPDVPFGALLLVPGLGAIGLAATWRRRRRRSPLPVV